MHEVCSLSAGTFVISRASFIFLRVRIRGAYHEVWPYEMINEAGSTSGAGVGERWRASFARTLAPRTARPV